MTPEPVTALEHSLREAVQGLAAPPEAQPHIPPPGSAVADELALNFDGWYRAALAEAGSRWPPELQMSLAKIDRLLAAMSGPQRPELWQSPDCFRCPEWAEVRTEAVAALHLFG